MSRKSSRRGEDSPETDVAALVAGPVPAANGGAAAPAVALPRPAAQHTPVVSALRFVLDRVVVTLERFVGAVVVRAPLPHIAVHVARAKGVRHERADGSGFLAYLAFGGIAVRKAAVEVGQGRI